MLKRARTSKPHIHRYVRTRGAQHPLCVCLCALVEEFRRIIVNKSCKKTKANTVPPSLCVFLPCLLLMSYLVLLWIFTAAGRCMSATFQNKIPTLCSFWWGNMSLSTTMWLTDVFLPVFGQKLWSVAAWHHQTRDRFQSGQSRTSQFIFDLKATDQTPYICDWIDLQPLRAMKRMTNTELANVTTEHAPKCYVKS